MSLAPGSRLGPYDVIAPLGAGGMGEVYRARDPRLGRDVALKVLPPELARDPERRRRFEREARSAGALSHPGILTVYDVGSEDGALFVVTELLEGRTLRECMRDGGLTLARVLDVAGQVAEGLAAAHARGIVHRDVKPDNLFVTRDGRVKILDFGLARQDPAATAGPDAAEAATDPDVLAGTAAYMSPEQVRRLPVDARSDLFSFGVTLYELLTRARPFRGATAVETMTAILREDPRPPSAMSRAISPALERVVLRCLEKRPEDRFQTAHDLALSLESLAASDAARRPARHPSPAPSPYPGLAAFGRADAGHFFGRESEVAAVLRRLEQRSLLALIGPSGAGKTSFLQAGLVPAVPAGWSALVVRPGHRPFLSLAQALAGELSGDADAIRDLLRFEEADVAVRLLRRWRESSAEALLIVDAFEEVFTLNDADSQARFASLIGDLVERAGLRVLLSMRDDFLFRCHAHPALEPVFSELTPIGPPEGAALRRALVQPALSRGYRFEDEALVQEMLEEVRHERGALPLLAFAAARLWEHRDEAGRRLTRAAYAGLGGVAGALARHAEATLERIGAERQGLVREVFRNLVTASGTRAARERGDLLSALPDQRGGEEVLSALVEARLLTTYEVSSGGAEPPRHDVEIVHESLLAAWPRLVRWRAQDADGALLRDQLRQAARTWEERGRPDDLLWSGKAYRELAVWREHYPGRLGASEDAFAGASALRAQRHRRRRRLLTAALLATVATLAAVFYGLWERAEGEKRHAEASELLALGRLRLHDHPAGALAYVIASLERADSEAARLFASEALQRGGAALIVPTASHNVDLSPDGEWLAIGGLDEGVRLWSRTGETLVAAGSSDGVPIPLFSPDGSRLVILDGSSARILTFPEPATLGRVDGGLDSGVLTVPAGSGLLSIVEDGRGRAIHALDADGAERHLVRRLDVPDLADLHVSPDGTRLAYARGTGVYVLPLVAPSGPPLRVGSHPDPVRWVFFGLGDHIVSTDVAGRVRIWSSDEHGWSLAREVDSGFEGPAARLDASGTRLVLAAGVESVEVWDLGQAPGAAPRVFPFAGEALNGLAIDREGEWLTVARNRETIVRRIGGRHPFVIPAQRDTSWMDVAFTPDGDWLAVDSAEEGLRLWPLSPQAAKEPRRLLAPAARLMSQIAVARDGSRILETSTAGKARLVTLGGGPPRELARFSGSWLERPAFSRDGRLAAAGSRMRPEGNVIEIWDLASGQVRTLDPGSEGPGCEESPNLAGVAWSVAFTSDGRLLSAGAAGLRLWDLASGESALLRPCRGDQRSHLAGSDVDRFLLAEVGLKEGVPSALSFHDLASGVSRELTSHGRSVISVALDPGGEIAVTGSLDGLVRVGPVTGEPPHILYGHQGWVTSVAVSRDGRWIASAGQDGDVRLWPMPEGPPLHAQPREAVLERLRASTNLRVVEDPGELTGYALETGPFPGWGSLPE